MATPDPHPWEQQHGESDPAFRALQCYLRLGHTRNVRAVGQELGKSRALVERWSRRWAWVERAKAYDAHMGKIAQAEAEKVHAESARDFALELDEARRTAIDDAKDVCNGLRGVLRDLMAEGWPRIDPRAVTAIWQTYASANLHWRRACTLTPDERGDQQADEATQDVTADEQRRILEAMEG